MPPEEKLSLAIIAEDPDLRATLVGAVYGSETFRSAPHDASPDVGWRVTREIRRSPQLSGAFVVLVAAGFAQPSECDRIAAEVAGADCLGPCVGDCGQMAQILECIGQAAVMASERTRKGIRTFTARSLVAAASNSPLVSVT